MDESERPVLRTVFEEDFRKKYEVVLFGTLIELQREDLEDDPILIGIAERNGYTDIREAFKDLTLDVFRRANTGSLL